MITRILVVIVAIVIFLTVLLYVLNHDVLLIKEDGEIKLRYYTVVWPPHVGGDLALFYKGKLICPSIVGCDPNLYLKSPDSNSILYIHYEPSKPETYELYDIKKGRKVIFPNDNYLNMPAGFNGKVEWFEDRIVLQSWDCKKKDILNLKNLTMESLPVKENSEK